MKSVFRRAVVSWIAAVLIEYLLLPLKLRGLDRLNGLAEMSLMRIVCITCTGMILFWLASRCENTAKAERWIFVGVISALAAAALYSSFTWAFLAVCILIVSAAVIYGIFGWDASEEVVAVPKKSHKAFLWITVGLSVCFFLFVSVWTVGRIYSFSTPTFDFGIFSQMFYHMKESGLPMTTVERDGLLSHFHVHVSPIWYLLLPFYALIPTPATLQVLQAAVMTSAVIPLWKIGKHHGLSGAARMLLCAVLLLYPAFSGGASYDIHENCFLTPLILWLFYGIDRKNIAVIAVSALLTLTVKEDAAVYVAVIALWLIVKTALRFRKTDIGSLITGFVMLAAALLYFFLVTSFLARIGDGVMTYRYSNFMYEGSSSLFTVIKSVILNPMKAVYECVDEEKLRFIALTVLPLLGLPLFTRRFERYILLIPYILVNLMSDFQYQHGIFYQYAFGSAAFLMYLTVINAADMKINRKQLAVLITAAVVSVGCFGKIIVPKAISSPVNCVKYSSLYQDIRDTLAQIPENASVTATTFYTTALSQREVLYDVRYSSKSHLLQTEYVVLNVSGEAEYTRYRKYGRGNGFENLVKLLGENAYELYAELDGVLVIYRKNNIKTGTEF